MLVVMGVDPNGDKALIAIDDAFAKSEESWAGVFESLRERGLKDVALLVADGAAGIWSAFSKAYLERSSSGAGFTRYETFWKKFRSGSRPRCKVACVRS